MAQRTIKLVIPTVKMMSGGIVIKNKKPTTAHPTNQSTVRSTQLSCQRVHSVIGIRVVFGTREAHSMQEFTQALRMNDLPQKWQVNP
jgi:hypothetical protein